MAPATLAPLLGGQLPHTATDACALLTASRSSGRFAEYLAPGRCRMDAALTAPHGPIWHGATVLVVDDEPVVRQFLRRTLEGEGFHVEEAQDGDSALRLIQAHAEPFDLVLTDLSMPQINGRQISETLRR